MTNLIEELQKHNNKLPAHFIFWEVTNKIEKSDSRKIFTTSTYYKTNQLLPMGFYKHISRNFNF